MEILCERTQHDHLLVYLLLLSSVLSLFTLLFTFSSISSVASFPLISPHVNPPPSAKGQGHEDKQIIT